MLKERYVVVTVSLYVKIRVGLDLEADTSGDPLEVRTPSASVPTLVSCTIYVHVPSRHVFT